MHGYNAGPEFRFLFSKGNTFISMVSYKAVSCFYSHCLSLSCIFGCRVAQFKQYERIITASEAC